MSYMRGRHYLWVDGSHVHIWSAEGYDGWDESGPSIISMADRFLSLPRASVCGEGRTTCWWFSKNGHPRLLASHPYRSARPGDLQGDGLPEITSNMIEGGEIHRPDREGPSDGASSTMRPDKPVQPAKRGHPLAAISHIE
jgi:hypothetical protein